MEHIRRSKIATGLRADVDEFSVLFPYAVNEVNDSKRPGYVFAIGIVPIVASVYVTEIGDEIRKEARVVAGK